MANTMPEKGHKPTAITGGLRIVLVEAQSQEADWRPWYLASVVEPSR